MALFALDCRQRGLDRGDEIRALAVKTRKEVTVRGPDRADLAVVLDADSRGGVHELLDLFLQSANATGCFKNDLDQSR